MPSVFRNDRIARDIELLLPKYPSLEDDIGYIENLLREGIIPSRRCIEFVPEWVWEVYVQISALEGHAAMDRCSLIYEKDVDSCYLLLLYDRDVRSYGSVLDEIRARR